MTEDGKRTNPGGQQAGLRQQLRRAGPSLIVAAALTVLVMGGAAAFLLDKNLPYSMLTMSPADFTDEPWYLAAVMHLGLLIWAAAVGAAGLASFLLHRIGSRPYARFFLLALACLSALFAIDNAFDVHNQIFLSLGISAFVTPAVYGLAALIIVVVFRRVWLATEYVTMFAAFVWFAASLFVDMAFDRTFVADSLKFAGIVFWFVYVTRTSVAVFMEERALLLPPGGSQDPSGTGIDS